MVTFFCAFFLFWNARAADTLIPLHPRGVGEAASVSKAAMDIPVKVQRFAGASREPNIDFMGRAGWIESLGAGDRSPIRLQWAMPVRVFGEKGYVFTSMRSASILSFSRIRQDESFFADVAEKLEVIELPAVAREMEIDFRWKQKGGQSRYDRIRIRLPTVRTKVQIGRSCESHGVALVNPQFSEDDFPLYLFAECLKGGDGRFWLHLFHPVDQVPRPSVAFVEAMKTDFSIQVPLAANGGSRSLVFSNPSSSQKRFGGSILLRIGNDAAASP